MPFLLSRCNDNISNFQALEPSLKLRVWDKLGLVFRKTCDNIKFNKKIERENNNWT
jgi:hypothetical protein